MQLVAYGAQDIYLTGNPQITFFKVVYRRHTNFSMESIEQTWNGITNADGRCTATISRNGDLIHHMYLDVLDTGQVPVNNMPNSGSQFIDTVELEIGGQMIDRHTGYWMETWSELTEHNTMGAVGSLTGVNSEVKGTVFQRMSGMGGINIQQFANQRFHIPLQFWFCGNVGLALPLIALQYHEVKVILDHQIATHFGAPTLKLWVDYIYLDTDERRRFAQVSHEYLIEQVQENSLRNGQNVNELSFNHPVKELIWIVKPASGAVLAGAPATGSLRPLMPHADQTTRGYQLKLNGHDRFALRPTVYFTKTQVWQHHSGAGGINSGGANAAPLVSDPHDAIGVYSFALKPEEHQPSGTCNFSRIDTAQFLSDSDNNVADTIFAVNYNVLRIMSGMGGLAYSN